MRITYLHQYFVPPGAPGGTRSYEFARRLIANGHDVHLITSTAFLPAEYQSVHRTLVTTIAGIPATILHVPYSNAMGSGARMHAFLRFATLASQAARRQPADVVFATSTPLTIAIPGIFASICRRVPMVFEVRDLWPEMPIAVGALRNPVLKAGARSLEWLAYHRATRIVALSPGMAEGVMRMGVPKSKVTVIPNSCDIELFDVPPERGASIRQRLPGLAPDQPLVVYTGTFGPINGVGYLVDVAAAMRTIAPEVHFLLVGHGAELEQVMAHAREAGVLNSTLWIWKPIPKQSMPDLLAAATIATSLFIPVRPMWNNSANKFFDALAAGKPIAINYGGWQADLLERSGAGVVLSPDDPVQAAHQLAAVVRNPQRLTQAAAASRILARTEFHRDEMASRLESVLRHAVEEYHSGTYAVSQAR